MPQTTDSTLGKKSVLSKQDAQSALDEHKVTQSIYFGMQRKIVAHMTTKSWKEVPHVSYVYEPDVTDFFQEYSRLNSTGKHETKITFNTLMLRALIEGVKAAPIMNSHIEYDDHYVKGRIDILENINITTPWMLPNGQMMTINLRDFGEKNLDGMTDYIAMIGEKMKKTDFNQAMYEVSLANTLDLVKHGHLIEPIKKLIGAYFGTSLANTLHGKAKKEYYKIPESERLTKRDLEPGTITISNIGSLYRELRGRVSLLEIIPPQVVAIGVGAVQDRPAVFGHEGSKEVGIRKILPICISFDHRAMDFGELIPFIKRMDEIFADPRSMHSW